MVITKAVMGCCFKMKKAVRHNQDKTRFDLIPPCFIREVAEVFTFGAKKYSPENWKGFTPEQQEEIKASLLRHIYAYLEGEELDPESGLSHLAHAGCNLAFLSYFKNQNEEANMNAVELNEIKIEMTNTEKQIVEK